jgi:4-cresol dehydrogenase (hydroxylating)
MRPRSKDGQDVRHPSSQDGGLAEALAEWSVLLGAERVSAAPAAEARYATCTTRIQRRFGGALRPQAADQIAAIVGIAARRRIPLHPISTGRNWGYGTCLPAVDGCVLLDLSDLRAIECVDAELGVFRLEPGVTQADLHAYLAERALPYMVPTTGAGPQASLVGNALERGYGITPTADHFAAVMRIEAVLADGSRYRPALSELGADVADQVFKWGVGPYLDGLFAQSGFGIVTAMTLALARRPERVEAFYFRLDREEQLAAAVAAVRRVLQTLPGIAGGINLMNRRRVLAMMAPYPAAGQGADGVLSDAAVAELARHYRIGAWMGMGALYGTAAVVAAARRTVREALGREVGRISFVGARGAALLARGARLLGRASGLATLAERIGGSLRILQGHPDGVALPLAYWRLARTVRASGALDPARDGCGLIWYAPLVPAQPDLVPRYVSATERQCRAHGIEPLITLSSLSDRCFDSSVPLLFDPAQAGAAERAHRCYDALLREGLALGVAPYRVHVGAMQAIVRADTPYWRAVGAIKRALDPLGIVAPGRYAPIEKP